MVEINVKNKKDPEHLSVHKEEKTRPSIPERLPVLPVRNMVMFPYTVTSIVVGQERSLRLLEAAFQQQKLMVIVAYNDPKAVEPGPDELYKVGCVAQILRSSEMSRGEITVLVQGLEKIRIDEWVAKTPYLQAKVSVLNDIEPERDDIEAEAVRNNLIQNFAELVSKISYLPDELVNSVAQTQDYRHMAYLIGSSMQLEVSVAQEILEQEDVLAKMLKLTDLINHEIEVMELGKKIQSEARGEMEKAQREYVLRQQLKAIHKELGEEDGSRLKLEEYQKKIETRGLSEEAAKQANLELKRLERIPEASSEYGMIMTYLDWLLDLPWSVSTNDSLNVKHVRNVLDEDHYGLDKIKARIIEYLAVRQLKQQRAVSKNKKDTSNQIRREREGAIICFVGPPGIGKTSLGHSIARAMGRKLHRISLGGVRDESEIRGHRRTYIGAMPGRFIKALRDVGTNNPVLLLDEVDKLGNDWRGDPSAALLEVLDPEQNREFRDHYLEVAFDLSQTMFIATANVLDSIPGPLRDRLEVITLPGYTDEEKLNIAQRYLVPRQRAENGLREEEFNISDEAMLKLIQEYTREAGVRSLDRRIGALCRKVVMKIAENGEKINLLEVPQLTEYLGKPMFYYDLAERTELPGVATGLAVTAVGGDILFIEASKMPGKKNLTITGQLGDVMRESVQAALSYVRSQTRALNIKDDFFEEMDIHIHIPAGAIPKDGPSAGVTLVTALVSLLTDRPVRHDVAMTGEITLRGQVLPVGGIKEKVIAAHRAGIHCVILPKRNEKDIDDLPESVRKNMEFVLAEQVTTVLETALELKNLR